MKESPSRNQEASRLGGLVAPFPKLGPIGFGGPAAHIAMMDDEVVARRRWLTREQFLDLVGAMNLRRSTWASWGRAGPPWAARRPASGSG